MAENSKIEWCHHTFNAWEGCEKISAGCANCYAERRDKQYHGGEHWGPNGTRKMMSESYWKQPLKWNRDAIAGERRRVFCSSLADVFEDRLELIEPRRRLFDLINETPNLDWLLLTKRPENIEPMFDDIQRHFGWDEDLSVMNIWLGTTVENQEQADKRIPELLKIPATVRFLSCEPLLEAICFRPRCETLAEKLHAMETGDASRPAMLDGIHWVICGGESGTDARPMHPDWARSLRDQCQAAGVPFFFKQWGEWMSYTNHTFGSKYHWFGAQHEPDCVRVGKKVAGRMLDGREWNEFPNAQTT